MTGSKELKPIPLPTPSEVQRYLDLWSAGNNEKLDVALRTLFQTMPRNTDVGEVAVKLAALNGLYSTNIFALVQVATHIANLHIDSRLAEPKISADLIEQIANVEIRGKIRRNYSFATKYCAFHRPDLYPIYDSLVQQVLNTFLRQGESFDTFLPGERWQADYGVWYRSITKFRNHYGLNDFSVRDIDKYLWMVAKERQALVD
jgi:hypothetical protein